MEPAVGVRLPLAERLRPKTLGEIVGNPRARADLLAWAQRWQPGTPPGLRAALLIGPPGVGKTTAAIALARDLGWTLVEMNASDARNQSAIEQVAGRASISHTLDGDRPDSRRRALILLDEADCLSGRATERSRTIAPPPSLNEFLQRRYGTVEALNAAWGLVKGSGPKPFAHWSGVPRSPGNHAWARLVSARRDLVEWRSAGVVVDTSDRGGLATIAKLVRSTRQPIVLTVNDDRPLTRYSPIFRTAVARIRFFALRDDELAASLAGITRSEGIALGSGVLEAIVSRAEGDFRAALNDLEAVAPLPPGPAQRDAVGVRDLASDFTRFTDEVLARPRYYRSVEVRDRLDAPPDDLLPWIEANLDRYAESPSSRDAGFRVLARAELLLARARRFRVFGLWSYASELLAGGVGLASRHAVLTTDRGAVFPQFLAEMGRTRGLRSLRADLAKKVGRRLHASVEKSQEILLPFLERLVGALTVASAPPELWSVARGLVAELGLTPEEVGYLLGGTADARLLDRLFEPVSETGPPETPRPVAGPVGSEPAPARPSTNSRRRGQTELGEFGPSG